MQAQVHLNDPYVMTHGVHGDGNREFATVSLVRPDGYAELVLYAHGRALLDALIVTCMKAIAVMEEHKSRRQQDEDLLNGRWPSQHFFDGDGTPLEQPPIPELPVTS